MLNQLAHSTTSSHSMTSSRDLSAATTRLLLAADACTSPWTATVQTGAWFSADGTHTFLAKVVNSQLQKTQLKHTAKKTAACSTRICTSSSLQKMANRLES